MFRKHFPFGKMFCSIGILILFIVFRKHFPFGKMFCSSGIYMFLCFANKWYLLLKWYLNIIVFRKHFPSGKMFCSTGVKPFSLYNHENRNLSSTHILSLALRNVHVGLYYTYTFIPVFEGRVSKKFFLRKNVFETRINFSSRLW